LKKRVWADYEQLLRLAFLKFSWAKKLIQKLTEKLHRIKVSKQKLKKNWEVFLTGGKTRLGLKI
jgi:hypothetical protein